MTVKVVFDQQYNPIFCRWLADKMSGPADFDPSKAVAFANVEFIDGQPPNILFVAAFHDRTQYAAQVSCASNGEKKQKITPLFIYLLFNYAFYQDNRTVVESVIDARNKESIALCEKMGFERCGEVPDHCGVGVPAYVYALTKERWDRGQFSKAPPELINNNKSKETLH
jgi:hypothetical protein